MYYLTHYIYAEEATNLFHSIVRASSIVVLYKAKTLKATFATEMNLQKKTSHTDFKGPKR